MAKASAKAPVKPAFLSLQDFHVQQRRKDCPVCKAPIEIRKQLAGARDRKVPRAVQIAWLTSLGVKVTNAEMDTHNNGRHDADL